MSWRSPVTLTSPCTTQRNKAGTAQLQALRSYPRVWRCRRWCPRCLIWRVRDESTGQARDTASCVRAGNSSEHDGDRRNVAARLHIAGRIRQRSQAVDRGLGGGLAVERVLPGALVDRPCLSPMRTRVAKRRRSWRDLHQTGLQRTNESPTCWHPLNELDGEESFPGSHGPNGRNRGTTSATSKT